MMRPLQAAPYATAGVVVLSGLAICCWAWLYPFYSLAGHYAVPYFAFEKIPDHFNSPILRMTTVVFLILSICYGAIYRLLQQAADLHGIQKRSIVVLVGAMLLVNLLLYPVGALDVYNYIVELKLALFYHQNPYVTTFMGYSSDPAGQFAFFNHVPLFYGPVWLLLSGVPTLITGFGDTQHVLVGLKIENVVLLAVTTIALYAYQDDPKRGWIAAYLFAANPLVVFETVANAHNDIMMTAFLVVGVLALHRRSLLTAPCLMLSVLVKFFSAALIPLFVLDMLLKQWSSRRVAGAVLAGLLLSIVLTWPVWASGRMLGGLTDGMAIAQSLNSESLFSLTREYLRLGPIMPPTEAAVEVAFAGVFAAAVLLISVAVWRGMPVERALIDTFLLFAVLVSLLTPWYLLPAFALIALYGGRAYVTYLLVATGLALLYYPLYVWAWFDSGMAAFQVHLFLALFLTLPIIVLGLTRVATAGVAAKNCLKTQLRANLRGIRRPIAHL